jgi:hypothetical protein
MLYFEGVVCGSISTAASNVAETEESADNLCITVTEMKSRSVVESDEEDDPVGRNSWSSACQSTVACSRASTVRHNASR